MIGEVGDGKLVVDQHNRDAGNPLLIPIKDLTVHSELRLPGRSELNWELAPIPTRRLSSQTTGFDQEFHYCMCHAGTRTWPRQLDVKFLPLSDHSRAVFAR